MDFPRRDLLTLSGSVVASTVLAPSALRAQTPQRGGVLKLRVWDPPHFDPYLHVGRLAARGAREHPLREYPL